jgi:hypothetical protein
MPEEITGPHGCGVYGHRFYGLTRETVEFMSTANHHHNGVLSRFVDTLHDDGAIDTPTFVRCKDIISELHKLIDGGIETVLHDGDVLHKKVEN